MPRSPLLDLDGLGEKPFADTRRKTAGSKHILRTARSRLNTDWIAVPGQTGRMHGCDLVSSLCILHDRKLEEADSALRRHANDIAAIESAIQEGGI